MKPFRTIIQYPKPLTPVQGIDYENYGQMVVDWEKYRYDDLLNQRVVKIVDEAKQKNQVLVPIFDGSNGIRVAMVKIDDIAQLKTIGAINANYFNIKANEWELTPKFVKNLESFMEYDSTHIIDNPGLDMYMFNPTIKELDESYGIGIPLEKNHKNLIVPSTDIVFWQNDIVCINT